MFQKSQNVTSVLKQRTHLNKNLSIFQLQRINLTTNSRDFNKIDLKQLEISRGNKTNIDQSKHRDKVKWCPGGVVLWVPGQKILE